MATKSSYCIVYNNKKLATYKVTSRKERLWSEKAEDLGKPKEMLRTWYSSLRSRYGRLKKKADGKSGDALPEFTEREEGIMKAFKFLNPDIYEVHKKPTVSVSINNQKYIQCMHRPTLIYDAVTCVSIIV